MQAASDSKRREDQLKLIDEAQFQQQFRLNQTTLQALFMQAASDSKR